MADGGWRGRKWHHRADKYRDVDPETKDGGDVHMGSSRGPRHRGGRTGHPPGLKGRAIGMWYASQSKKKKSAAEIQSRQHIQMDDSKRQHLTDLLSAIRTTVPSQPGQSYQNIKDTESDSNDSDESLYLSSSGQTLDSWKVKQESHKTNFLTSSSSSSCGEEPADWYEVTEDNAVIEHRDKTCHVLGSDAVNTATMSATDSTKTMDVACEVADDHSGNGQDCSVAVKTEPNEMTDDIAAEGGKADDADDVIDLTVDQVSELKVEGIDDVTDCVSELLHQPMQVVSSSGPSDIIGLVKNDKLDRELEEDYRSQHRNKKYVAMMEFRKKLPSYRMKQEIIETIAHNQIVVLSGETGCGKTTQIPQFILDDYIERGCGSLCRVVCTQPRRISAITIAERVADERAESLGVSVGYQIRLEQKVPRAQASILYCTTGIMLKWLVSDPKLKMASHIILDEIHERDVLSDFLMIIIRDLVAIRPDIKVVLMSATLNAQQFSAYFNGCPMLNIPGFTFPVKEYLLEDVFEMLKYTVQRLSPDTLKSCQFFLRQRHLQQEQAEYQSWARKLKGYSDSTKHVLSKLPAAGLQDIDYFLVSSLIRFIITHKSAGAILVFVPGWEQIRKLSDTLNSEQFFQSDKFRIIPLHSLMPTVNQRQVFERPPADVHKIVIATNIAETSITIDDVVYVIDCGKIKMKNFDVAKNIQTLLPEWVSRANARQRSGRAGRVQPGECFHLYTSFHEAKFADYQLPEMLRTRLEELCLQIKLMKLGRIKPFISKAMEPPSSDSVDHAINMLIDLNALDHNEELTPLGYHLARMPVEPHVGKMLLFGAIFSCIDPISTIAASLGFKDAFFIPMGREKEADERRRRLAKNSFSDHIMLANAFKDWEIARSRGTHRKYCWDNFLSSNTLMMLDAMKKQFTNLLHEMGFLTETSPKSISANRNSGNEKLLKAVICAGLYPNVGKLHTVFAAHQQCVAAWPPRLATKTEPRVNIHPKSVNANERNFPSPHLVYFLKMKTQQIYIHDCTAVSAYALLFFGGDIEFRKDRGQNCVVIDDWLIFKSSKRVAHVVLELRKELDKLLERCVSNPGIYGHKDIALLRAIVDLVTNEQEVDCEPTRGVAAPSFRHRRGGRRERYH